MKFDFSKPLKTFDGTQVPKRALIGGIGQMPADKVRALAVAVQATGVDLVIAQRVVDQALSANDEPLTLGGCLVHLLLHGVEEQSRTDDGRIVPKQIDPADKIRRGKLAEKLWDEGVIEIDDGERQLCKELSAAILGPEMAFLVDRALDTPAGSDD